MSELISNGGTARLAGRAPSRAATLPGHPALWLLVAVAAAAALLCLPLTLPLGPMYWDLVLYFDAANRIFDGQVPSIDFFAPVGPLGYWIFAGALRAFPQAQPLLLVHWSTFAITAPAMAAVLIAVDRRSRGTAFALLLPFLAFQLLPMNVEQYSTYPGADGYGIYNRQICEILYVLVSALVFVRGQRLLLGLIAWCCLALFLVKITGLVAGGLLCAFAFAAGRVRLPAALGAAGAFLAVLALMEASSGLVGSYLHDVLQLIAMNEGGILGRFVQAASIHFGVLAPGLLLVLTLLWQERAGIGAAGRALAARPRMAALAPLLDRGPFWLAAVLLAGFLFETQNTGGQAFIFVWPAILAIVSPLLPSVGRREAAVLALAAATVMPPFVNVLHRSARMLIGQFTYERLAAENLRSLGQVTQRREVLDRSALLAKAYTTFPETYRLFVDHGQLPSFTLYTELDFQAGWLRAANEAVGAIRAFEAAHGVHFATIMSLNFANPFPYLLDRSGTHGIAIGADPYRAVPPPDAETLRHVADTDLVLLPTCPITGANEKLRGIYGEGLRRHVHIRLSPCWEAYIRPELAPGS